MKIFFEAIEKTDGETEGEFTQIEVSSKEEAAAKAAGCNKTKYLTRVHYCYHDESPAKPCTVEEI